MYDRILLPTDEESMSVVVDHAADIASRRDAEVHVLFVLDDRAFLTLDESMQDDALEQLGDTGEAAVSEAADRLADAGVTVETELRKGDPGEEILEYVGDRGIDLVVMGTRRDDYSKSMLGSVSQTVIVNADAPVLTVNVGDEN
jgi:nucleotide-binding universal stress UspA family protein